MVFCKYLHNNNRQSQLPKHYLNDLNNNLHSFNNHSSNYNVNNNQFSNAMEKFFYNQPCSCSTIVYGQFGYYNDYGFGYGQCQYWYDDGKLLYKYNWPDIKGCFFFIIRNLFAFRASSSLRMKWKYCLSIWKDFLVFLMNTDITNKPGAPGGLPCSIIFWIWSLLSNLSEVDVFVEIYTAWRWFSKL